MSSFRKVTAAAAGRCPLQAARESRPEMPKGGRYRYVRVALWGEPRFQALSADARLLLLNLRTGSASNLAGIGYVYVEALERETGLTPGEIRNGSASSRRLASWSWTLAFAWS